MLLAEKLLIILLWLKKSIQYLNRFYLKLLINSELLNTKNTLNKGYTKKWPREVSGINSVFKLIHGRIELKIGAGKKQ